MKFQMPTNVAESFVPDPEDSGPKGAMKCRARDVFWLSNRDEPGEASVTFLSEIHDVHSILTFDVTPNQQWSQTGMFCDGAYFGGHKSPFAGQRGNKSIKGSNVWYYSIVDHRRFVGNDGTVYENERKLLPLKRDSQIGFVTDLQMALKITSEEFEEITRAILDNGGTLPAELGPLLRGTKWTVVRPQGERIPKTGSKWYFEGRVSEEELEDYKCSEPYDLVDRLMPDPNEEQEYMKLIGLNGQKDLA